MSDLPVAAVDTPAFLVDLPILRANIDRVARAAAAADRELRPHMKAHKTPAIARLQLAAGAVGVTAAKVGEAEAMVEGGVADVFVANEIVGEEKLRRLAGLRDRAQLSLACDSVAVAEGYSAVFREGDDPMDVLVEIDLGAHRCGVPPEGAVALAEAMASLPGLRVVGVMGYAPMSYAARTDAERDAAAADESRLLAEVGGRLRAAGHAISRISGGSTPTATCYRRGCGLTEIRSGTYIFYDMNQVDLGVVGVENVAATILATVISTPSPGRAIVDAGSKAMATQVKPISPGFGWMKGNPGAFIDQLNDEHGYLDLTAAERGVAIGEKIELIPPRVCTALNLYDDLYLVEKGCVVDRCRVTGRGRSR
jgi:D-serine deaminase-like pyridoxal phosphate-dependent protein